MLQGLTGVQVYFDDILVTGKDDMEHLKNLEAVMERLSKFGLRIRPDKCVYLQPSVEYLGHVIDKNGLHKATAKVEAILAAPEPRDVAQLRSVLGMFQYYHKFIPNLAAVLHPLNQLLGKVKWEWSKACTAAFLKVKKLLCEAPILTHYDTEKPLRLACDASPYGLGAVISHVMPNGEEKPVGYASRSLTKAEQNYSQIDREALGIIFGVKKFFQYLYGREFTLVTDNKPLTSIFHPSKEIPPLAASRLQRWSLYLSAFNYKVEFRRTAEHSNADGLSRVPLKAADDGIVAEQAEMHYLSAMPVTSSTIATHTRRDKILSRVYDFTLKGWPDTMDENLKPYFKRKHELTIENGCVLWGYRVLVPESLRETLLNELHEGHLGIVKMKMVARSYIWWPNMDNDIETLAKSCSGCAQTQAMPNKANVYPWSYPEKPWQRIHIDFCEYEKVQILVIIDAYSKWPEAVVMKDTTASRTIKVLKECFARYGIPDQIHSDNGPQFVSEEFKNFLRRNGIKQTLSAPYSPSTNGLAERFVKSVKQGIKSMKTPLKDETIHDKLAAFLLAYRNAPHSTTGESPATLFLGRSLKSRLDLVKPNIRNRVQQDQQKMAMSKQGVQRQFDIGDKVLARSYRGKEKWKPGEIVAMLGKRTYRVQIPDHGIWKRHLNQLRSTQAPPTVEKDIDSERLMNIPIPRFEPPPSNQASTPTHEDNVVSQDANQNTPPVPQQVPPLIVVNPERPKRSCGPPKRLITTMDYLNFDLLDEEQI